MKACISYASTLVLAYGSPYNDFEVNRGLHEGDRLAPFIFILAIKCLYSILVNKNVLKVCKISKKACEVSLKSCIKVYLFEKRN